MFFNISTLQISLMLINSNLLVDSTYLLERERERERERLLINTRARITY